MTGSSAGGDGPTVQRVLALKTFPVLAELGADDLAAIAERAHGEHVRHGAVLTNGRETPEVVRLVVAGEVDEQRDGGPDRRRRGPCIVGGLEALSGRAGDRIVAASDLETLSLDAAGAFWELLEESFDLALACLANLARATVGVRRRLVPSGGYPPPDAAPDGEAPLTVAEQVAAVRRAGPLEGAPAHALGLLAHEGELSRYDSGRRIWSIGDEADRVLVVLAGRARATSSDRHEFDLGVGSIVGADTALAGEPRWYDLTAAGPLGFIDLSVDRLLDVLEDDWPMTAHVLRATARELADLRARRSPQETTG